VKLSKTMLIAIRHANKTGGFIRVTNLSTFRALRDRGLGKQTEYGLLLTELGRVLAEN